MSFCLLSIFTILSVFFLALENFVVVDICCGFLELFCFFKFVFDPDGRFLMQFYLKLCPVTTRLLFSQSGNLTKLYADLQLTTGI